MSDEADRSDGAIEMAQTVALTHRASEGPPPCGECHYCGEPLNDGRRFCDADCRDDWQREMDALRRNLGQEGR